MNPYDVLGVSPSASDGELHRAYVRLARRWHPDLNDGSPEAEHRMRELNEAWAVVGDPAARARYDRARPDPGFVPDDPVDDGFDPRAVPDTPYRVPSGIHTRWSAVASAPVALFVAGVTVIVFGPSIFTKSLASHCSGFGTKSSKVWLTSDTFSPPTVLT